MSETPNENANPVTPTRGPDIARSIDLLLICYIAFAVSPFTAGFGAIVGVVIAYMQRPTVAGTWRESHYTWLIRTFFISLLGALVCIVLFFLAFILGPLLLIWMIVRLYKGWVAYSEEKPIPDPENWLFG